MGKNISYFNERLTIDLDSTVKSSLLFGKNEKGISDSLFLYVQDDGLKKGRSDLGKLRLLSEQLMNNEDEEGSRFLKGKKRDIGNALTSMLNRSDFGSEENRLMEFNDTHLEPIDGLNMVLDRNNGVFAVRVSEQFTGSENLEKAVFVTFLLEFIRDFKEIVLN